MDEGDIQTPVARTPPAALKRLLEEEAGHRCAVPTCRTASVLEFAHITPWAEVRRHDFTNMIVLCSLCHGLYDRERKITRSSILAYKRNLAVLNGRYNDFERRMLEMFHERGLDSVIKLDFSDGVSLSVRNLVRDGLVEFTPDPSAVSYARGGLDVVLPLTFSNPRLPKAPVGERTGGTDQYTLTETGQQFVRQWFGAEPVEGV